MVKTGELEGMSGPGVAQKKIKEVEDLAASYVKERDKRCRQTPKEKEAKVNLIEALHRHEKTIGRDSEGVLRYKFSDTDGEPLVIELRHTEEKLKVRKADEDDQD